jgi:hypothetical protein
MKRLTLLAVLVALLSIACSLGGPATAPDANALSTQIAATVNAALNLVPTSKPVVVPPTKAPIVLPPTATQEPIAPPPTATQKPIAPPPTATQEPSNPPASGGSFTPIVFSIGENDEKPVDTRIAFPDGVTMVYAIFSGVKLTDGQAWRHEWYYNGELQDQLSDSSTWDAATAGPDAVWWLTIYNKVGVRTGKWELRLYLGDNMVQSGQFTIEKNGEPDFGPITFSGGQENDQPVDPVDVSDPTFSADTAKVYAFWSGLNVPKGTAYTREWYLNGKLLQSKDDTWDFAPTDENWVSFASSNGTDPLTAGTYELKLLMDGNIVNIGSFVVTAN